MDNVVLEERTFSEVKRLCCAGRLDGPALLGEVIERLRRVVPFEAYCASTKDPASGFITYGMAEELGGADDSFWSLEHLYFEHHQSVRRMMDIHQSVALLSESTGGAIWSAPPATWSISVRSGSPTRCAAPSPPADISGAPWI